MEINFEWILCRLELFEHVYNYFVDTKGDTKINVKKTVEKLILNEYYAGLNYLSRFKIILLHGRVLSYQMWAWLDEQLLT